MFKVHTTAFPCVYCARNIIEGGVRNLFVDGELDPRSLNGDDGLSMDWLKNVFQGKVVLVPKTS